MPAPLTTEPSDMGRSPVDRATVLDRIREFPDRLETSRRLRVAVVGAIFTATTLVFLWQALLGFGTFAAVDMNELGDPYRSAIERPTEVSNIIQTDQVEVIPYIVAFTDGLKHLDYRIWDPNVAAGVPLGSLPTFLMVSPFNVSFLFTPPWYAIGLKVALQFLAGQILMYLFLRRLRVGVLAAALGAVLYVFSGTNIVLIHRMTVTFLVPGALWAAHRVVTARRWRDIALMSLLIGWGWLEGFPSGWSYLVYLTAGWIAWLVIATLISDIRGGVSDAWPAALKKAGAGIAGIIGGTLLAAFTMIPFIVELLDRGTLEGRVLAASVAPLRPAQLLGLVDASTLGEWRGAAYNWWTGTNPVESAALVGGVAAILVAVGYAVAIAGRLKVSPSGRSAWAYFSVSAGLLTIATYFGTPVLAVINRVPGLAGNPVNRTRFVVAFAAAIVAALTVDWLTSQSPATSASPWDRSRVKAPRVISAVVLGFATMMTVLAIRDWIPLARANGDYRTLATGVMWTVIGSVVVVVVAIVVSRVRAAAPWVMLLVIGFGFAQLAAPYYHFTPTAPVGDFYAPTAGHDAIAVLAGDEYRFAATGLTTFYPNGSQVVGAPDLRGAAMHSKEFKNLIRTINPIAFDRDAFKIILARDEWDLTAPALDHLAVKYFAVDTRERPVGVPRDFLVETTTSDLGGSGPYSIAGGSTKDGRFFAEVDETTPANQVRFTGTGGQAIELDYPGSPGARVAVGDLDGVPGDEILIVPSGPGDDVRVFDPSGALVGVVPVGRTAPAGGWWPSIGDTDGDGRNEIILGAGAGAPPTVTVLESDGTPVSEFTAYDPGFFGGVSTGAGDVDDDGIDEIVVGPGAGGGPHVRVFDETGALDFDFFAYDVAYTGGVVVAVGDPVPGGGEEIVAASLDGSQPVVVFAKAAPIGSFITPVSGYYRLAAGDVIGDERDEILVGGDEPAEGTVSIAATDGELVPIEWIPLVGSAERTATVLGPFSAVAIALDPGDRCDIGRIGITVGDAAGTVLGSSERKIRDIATGWNTFAVDGQWVDPGTVVDIVVENRSGCDVQIGTDSSGSAPAVRWFSPDPAARLVSTEQAWIYERPDAWPLVSVHGKWRQYETQEEALKGLVSDPDTLPYVGPESPVESGGPAPTLVRSETTRQGATAVTEGSAGGLVMFSQNDALGWKVSIDGEPVDHVSVDGALLGVIVPPGRHTIEFSYAPWHFRVGVAITSATALLLAVAVIFDRRRTEQKRPPRNKSTAR